MSREIQFRAWDVINKEMFYIAYPSWNGIVEGKKEGMKAGEIMVIDSDGDNKPILLQYTGLSDKNGVEIYEGDIILIDNGEKYEKKNGWAEDRRFSTSVVEWKIDHFGADYEWGDDKTFLLSSYPNCEVKGNIYENPDLIKQYD